MIEIALYMGYTQSSFDQLEGRLFMCVPVSIIIKAMIGSSSISSTYQRIQRPIAFSVFVEHGSVVRQTS